MPAQEKHYILCVDDQQIVLNALNRQLQNKFGNRYNYEFAESGEEALELMENLTGQGYTFAAIISDQIMPGMSGDEFLSRVHKKYPKPLKILLTGEASIESAINVINNADLYRYLTKPWNEESFLNALETGLQECDLAEETYKQNEVFRRFLPNQFLEYVNTSIMDIKLGDHIKRDMSILFSDIRNFGEIAENMTAKENYDFINAYLGYIDPAIQKNSGFVYKYMADAVLALFHTSEESLKAALAMQYAIKQFNEDYINSKFCPISSDIGLHTSVLTLGVVGVSDRMQGTVVSEAVSLTIRLQKRASLYEVPIIVSTEFLEGLDNAALKKNFRDLGQMDVKNRQAAVFAHEIIEPTIDPHGELKILTKDDFVEGIKHFSAKEFSQAVVHFKKVLEKNPQDKIAQFYLNSATNSTST